MKDLKNEKDNKIKGILLLSAVIVVTVALWYAGKPLIKYVEDPEKFRMWVDSHGITGYIAFVLMVIFQIVVAIVPGEPFELAAGYAFGAVKGTILCIIAGSIGSLLVFLLVRKYGYRLALLFFEKEKIDSLSFLRISKKKEALFFLIYMLPGVPKDLIGYFAGLSDISITSWFFISTIGRIPSIITSTFGGNALSEKNYFAAVIIFAGTAIVSLLGILIYNRIVKKHSENEDII